MNKIFTLRSLAIFSFVIFLPPFMRTCSDRGVKELVKTPMEISEEDSEDAPVIFSSNEEYQQAIAETKKNYTFNFYSLTVMVFDGFNWKNVSSDKNFWAFLGFSIILFSSIFILICSLANSFKIIFLLSTINLVILFISTLIFYLTEIIENINQIKIGYYLFVLNSIALIFLSKRILTEKENPVKTSNL